MLTDDQLSRYARQILLPQVGGRGQEKIGRTRALVVGVGGLGCPAALYLAAAGVGTLGLLDNDPVEVSNLHRQILHYSTDLGRPKVLSAKGKLMSLNPEVTVHAHRERLDSQNAPDIFSGYDIVVDGSDNFPTRYLVNDVCVRLGLPLVSGAVTRFEGQVTTIIPRSGHCYRCVFPDPPAPEAVQNCAEAGVLGAAAGVVGSLQAAEVLKWSLGLPDLLKDRLLTLDLEKMIFRTIPVKRDQTCLACGENSPVLLTNSK